MKEFPPKLIGVMLCAATLNSADGRTVAPQTPVEEVHAAITDMPDIIDMSNADPRTWKRLPPAAQVQVLVHDEEFRRYPIRTRPY